MHKFFYSLPKNAVKIFSGYNLLWHVLAIVFTYIIVANDFDWTYHNFFQHFFGYQFFFLGAGLLGFIIPVLLPVGILVFGKIRKNLKLANTAWALGQAAILAMLISWAYKVFTGRPGPEIMANVASQDITKVFRFGFLRGGIFWGWPSSHTMVAFAVSTALIILYPKNNLIKLPAVLFALYVGFGASISFHWFSDCIAGAIIGTLVGIAVGKSFAKN